MGIISRLGPESLAAGQHREYILNFQYLLKEISSAGAAENKKKGTASVRTGRQGKLQPQQTPMLHPTSPINK